MWEENLPTPWPRDSDESESISSADCRLPREYCKENLPCPLSEQKPRDGERGVSEAQRVFFLSSFEVDCLYSSHLSCWLSMTVADTHL